ncbi:MAG: BON domain-containing protein [Opitutaceae bacterium]
MKTSSLLLLAGLLVAPVALVASSATDNQTESAIKQSYTFRTTLDNNVKVDVDDGVATLTGKVRDDEQSRVAEDTAAAFSGVSHVVNKLKVENDPNVKQGSDEWIALKIRSRLLVKANVSLTNTKVDVRNGVVYLTGTADNTAQKDLTEAYVKDIDGVRSVTNDIRVVTPADKKMEKMDRHNDRNNNGGYTTGDKIDDSSITAQVKYELFSHRSTSALKTKVETHEGRVTITGDANNDAEKDLVTKLAKSVRGVDSVDNNMMVRN